ncbi:hypothetical protein E2562_013348 [Oryza meyeriana var. granulata]|uniref:Uncharacterized protein n=1 Tax=Oryza meyeriana var. granulata TaxID=110450 RepID=A0A6G1CG08_9ORYZ|nr:hypothetical protein E2562_013348 [Oryza meyeriana var. granulata]
MYLVIAGLWICHAGLAASDVAVRLRGEGSGAHAVASHVTLVAILAVLPVIPVATSLHAVRITVSDTETEKFELPADIHYICITRAYNLHMSVLILHPCCVLF